MTNETKDGGPAFACAAENGHQPGMSLRDYFAGQAMAGFAVNSDGPLDQRHDETRFQALMRYWLQVAEGAYVFADAMLKAREEKP